MAVSVLAPALVGARLHEVAGSVMVQVGGRRQPGDGIHGARRGQRGTTFFQVPLGAGQLGERFEAGEQFDGGDALGNEVSGAGALGLHAHFGLVVARYDRHRQGGDARQARAADALQQPVAVQTRHADVGDDRLDGGVHHQGLPAVFPVRFLADLETPPQVPDQGSPDHAGVVYDQDPGQGLTAVVVHAALAVRGVLMR